MPLFMQMIENVIKQHNEEGRRENRVEKSIVKDSSFNRGSLDIISAYLRAFSCEHPAKSLEYFVEQVPRREGKITELQKARRQSIGSLDNKIVLLEKLRMHIVFCLRDKMMPDRALLKKYHLSLHLLELFLKEDMSYFEKINTFLNTNFKLHDNDFWSHAVRGNFYDMMRARPDLSPALAAFLANEAVKSRLSTCNLCELEKQPDIHYDSGPYKAFLKEWKGKYNIEDRLYSIMSGNWTRHSDDVEAYCYGIAYGRVARYRNKYIAVIDGDFTTFIDESHGWLKIVLMLVLCLPVALSEYESCFESMFKELVEYDLEAALGFLAYSRNCGYHLNLWISRIDLDNQVVNQILRYTKDNGLDNDLVIQKYIKILEERGDYEYLCKFIVANSVTGVNYSVESLKYFIKHYDRFRSLVDEQFLQDPQNLFVHKISSVSSCDYKTLEFLVSHEYADCVIDVVALGVLNNKNSDAQIAHSCLGRVIAVENKHGVVHKDAKLQLMKRILE